MSGDRRGLLDPLVRRARWIGLVAGFLLAALDTVAARSAGITFQMSGRDVTAVVWLYLTLSFGGLGFLVGYLLEVRRRERLALAALGRRTATLEGLRLRLAQSEKLAALGQLAAMIAHELRNPLAIIRSTVQNLEEDAGDPEEVRRSCGFVRQEIDRLGRVISSLLAFARPLEPRLRDVTVEDLLERVELLAPPELRAKEIRFEVRDRCNGATLRIDQDLISQALVGLLSNAAQATPRGGLVVLEAREQESGVVLAVRDSGPGVPPGERHRIFEPFFSTRDDGHGLGLAVARQIADAHGAGLSVGDDAAGGACFSLELRRSQERERSP